MTVKELKEKLANYSDDLEVIVQDHIEGNDYSLEDVKETSMCDNRSWPPVEPKVFVKVVLLV